MDGAGIGGGGERGFRRVARSGCDPAGGSRCRSAGASRADLRGIAGGGGRLNLMIAAQMWLRARSGALDPPAGQDDASLQVNQRALTNTVEQLAGFVPALLAVAAGVSSDRMRFVVAAGVVFAVARLVFWGGYLLGPMMRAPGMAATFAVNIATLAAAIWVWWP